MKFTYLITVRIVCFDSIWPYSMSLRIISEFDACESSEIWPHLHQNLYFWYLNLGFCFFVFFLSQNRKTIIFNMYLKTTLTPWQVQNKQTINKKHLKTLVEMHNYIIHRRKKRIQIHIHINPYSNTSQLPRSIHTCK